MAYKRWWDANRKLNNNNTCNLEGAGWGREDEILSSTIHIHVVIKCKFFCWIPCKYLQQKNYDILVLKHSAIYSGRTKRPGCDQQRLTGWKIITFIPDISATEFNFCRRTWRHPSKNILAKQIVLIARSSDSSYASAAFLPVQSPPRRSKYY